MSTALPLPDPETEPTLTVERTAQLLGISRNGCYQAIARGEVPALRIGRRMLVPTARLRSILGLGAPAA